jgi:hypothetical protein
MSTIAVSNIKNASATNTAIVLDTAGTVQHYSTISVGNATPSSSGAGITFPATQSASSNANTLDDYEEGTWTPTLTSQAGTITSYSVAYATYVKIGRKVLAEFRINSIVAGTASGDGFISGWPFTAANSTAGTAASSENGWAQAFTLGTNGSGGVAKYDGTTVFANNQNIIVQVNYDI